jgi:hypothetical protein
VTAHARWARPRSVMSRGRLVCRALVGQNGRMALSHDEALTVQRRHEDRLMHLPGVNAVGVKLRDGALVLEVSVDPGADVPSELEGVDELDGLPVVIERQRYELQ